MKLGLTWSEGGGDGSTVGSFPLLNSLNTKSAIKQIAKMSAIVRRSAIMHSNLSFNFIIINKLE